MHEIILANLLLHVAAGTTLAVVAAVSAVTDRLQRRSVATYVLAHREQPVLVSSSGSPRPSGKTTVHEELEAQSEAA